MWVRFIIGLVIGLLLLGASFVVPSFPVGSIDPRTWLAAAGATTLVGVLLVSLALTPSVRAASRLRAERQNSSVWLVQRGVNFRNAVAPFCAGDSTSTPNHLVLVADKGGIEFWRTVPLVRFASIEASLIRNIRVQAGHPQAHLVVEAKTSSGEDRSLMVVPGSVRSGPFPASPTELGSIQKQIESSLLGEDLRG
jgi:hypothetical protein